MESVFIGLAFAAGFLLIFGVNLLIADVLAANRQRIKKRLEEEWQLQQRERARSSLLSKKMLEDPAEQFFETNPKPTLQKRFTRYIEESGLRIRPGQIALLAVVAAAAGALILKSLTGSWVVAAFTAPFAGGLPFVLVSVVRARRLEKMLAQLPDAFDLMSRTLRSGQTTSQALQAVADEFSPPVADEFGYCYDQQNLGLSPEESLKDLAARNGLLELKIFVLAVMIHRQTGGNLAQLLDKLAAVIRDRYRIHGVIKALTADGRLQAVILLALPPGMLILLSLVNPSYMSTLYEYPLILLAMFASMTVGGLWMNRIIRFDF